MGKEIDKNFQQIEPFIFWTHSGSTSDIKFKFLRSNNKNKYYILLNKISSKILVFLGYRYLVKHKV